MFASCFMKTMFVAGSLAVVSQSYADHFWCSKLAGHDHTRYTETRYVNNYVWYYQPNVDVWHYTSATHAGYYYPQQNVYYEVYTDRYYPANTVVRTSEGWRTLPTNPVHTVIYQ